MGPHRRCGMNPRIFPFKPKLHLQRTVEIVVAIDPPEGTDVFKRGIDSQSARHHTTTTAVTGEQRRTWQAAQ